MGQTATVRIPEVDKQRLKELSEQLGIPQSQVVSRALKELRRKALIDAICEDFQQLRSDPVASKEYDEEFKAWDVTLTDGMEGY